MTIPSRIRVLGIAYTVEFVEVVDKFEPKWGMTDYESQRILIDAALPNDRKAQVFMHELVHCILECLGMDELNEDEGAVQRIAAALHQTLADAAISF